MKDYAVTIDPDTLATTVAMPTAEKVARDVQQTISRDHEGKVRATLIALGWMPPDVAAQAQGALAEAIDASVRRGVGVHWDVLTPSLALAHDAITALKD